MKRLLIAVLLSIPMAAEPLPDAPSALVSPTPLPTIAAPTIQQHKFWDRQQKIAFWSTAGIRAADIASTCYALRSTKVVDGVRYTKGSSHLPVKSCAGVTAWIAGEQGIQTLTSWMLHKRGMHNAERWMPWVAAGHSGTRIGMNIHTTWFWKAPKRQPEELCPWCGDLIPPPPGIAY